LVIDNARKLVLCGWWHIHCTKTQARNATQLSRRHYIQKGEEPMHGKLLILSGVIFSGAIALNGNLVWSQTKGSSGSPGPAGQESSDRLKSGEKESGAASGGSSQEKSGSVTGSSQDKSGSAKGSSSSGSAASSQERSGSASGSQMDRAGRSGGDATGQSSENIKQVQEALKNKGHDPGAADGVMGPKTQQALRAFQKQNGMQATGRLDDKTASALGVDASGSGKAGASGADKGSSGSGASSSGRSSSSEKPSSTESPTGSSSKGGASGSGSSPSSSPSSSGSGTKGQK
jgi:peptidoglycan hydrolase-like protein with peptidoglycan-binding domain